MPIYYRAGYILGRPPGLSRWGAHHAARALLIHTVSGAAADVVVSTVLLLSVVPRLPLLRRFELRAALSLCIMDNESPSYMSHASLQVAKDCFGAAEG